MKRFFISNNTDVVVNFLVKNVGDQTIADAHLHMSSHFVPRKNGGVFGFDRPNLNVGVLAFQSLANARDGAARANTRAEAVNRPFHVLEDFLRGVVLVGKQVVDVFELLRDIHVGVFRRHAVRSVDAFLNALANVAVIVNDDHVGTVMANQLAAFFRNAIRHDDNRFISTYRSNQRQTNTLISAGRLNNNGVGLDIAALFGGRNHLICGAGLYAAAHVDAFELADNLSGIGLAKTIEANERRVAHGLQYIVVNHSFLQRIELFIRYKV